MSSERSFLKTASSRLSKVEAEEFLGKLKSAGAAEAVKGFAKQYGPELAAGTIGALALTGAQYLSSKRGKGGDSMAERSMPEPGEKDRSRMSFVQDLAYSKDKAMSDYAGVSSRHPLKSSMFVAPAGVATGLGALAILRRLKGV